MGKTSATKPGKADTGSNGGEATDRPVSAASGVQPADEEARERAALAALEAHADVGDGDDQAPEPEAYAGEPELGGIDLERVRVDLGTVFGTVARIAVFVAAKRNPRVADTYARFRDRPTRRPPPSQAERSRELGLQYAARVAGMLGPVGIDLLSMVALGAEWVAPELDARIGYLAESGRVQGGPAPEPERKPDGGRPPPVELRGAIR